MPIPTIRRFTRAQPAALNTFALATDDESGLTFIRITGNNAILDIVNSPDPAAGLLYTIRLQKQFVDAGKVFYSIALSPASAGRQGVGVINISPGDYSFSVAQTLGALTAFSFAVKFIDQP